MRRILLMGGPVTGKSTAWLSIARYCHKFKRDVKFHVMDGDNDIAEQGEDVAHLLNIIVPRPGPDGWVDYKTAMDKFRPNIRPWDFLIVDRMDRPWEDVATWYTNRVIGQTLDEFQMQWATKQLGNKSADGDPLFKHYRAINDQYFAWQNGFLPNNPCHLICCVGAKPVITEAAKAQFKDGKDIEATFAGIGYKPGGQKGIPHHFGTIIFLEQAKRGEIWYTTVRERAANRQPETGFSHYDHEPVKDFCRDYMLRSNWKPGGIT